MIREFPGNYTDWKAVNDGKMDIEELENLNNERHSERSVESREPLSLGDKSTEPTTKKQLSQKRKSLSNKEREELKQVESRIEALELRKKEVNQAMTDHASDHEKMAVLGSEISEVTNELWDLEERWLELNE